MNGKHVPNLKRLSDLIGTEDEKEETEENSPENALDPEVKGCLKSAMRTLAYGDRSERQLREKLTEKGYGALQIAEVFGILRSKRYLDDLRYMENAARYMARTKLYGRGRIRMELLQRVDRRTVESRFDEVMEALPDIDFTEIARKRAEKRKGKSREYVIADLKRNGFTGDEIRRALAGKTDGQ